MPVPFPFEPPKSGSRQPVYGTGMSYGTSSPFSASIGELYDPARAAYDTTAMQAGAVGVPTEQPKGLLTSVLGGLDRIVSAGSGFTTGLLGADMVDEKGNLTDRAGFLDIESALERAAAGFGGKHQGWGDTAALRIDEGDGRLERYAKMGAAFTGDVLSDPLTYVSFGTSIGRGAASKVAAGQLLKASREELLEAAGRRSAGEAAAARMTTKELLDEGKRAVVSEGLDNRAILGALNRTNRYDYRDFERAFKRPWSEIDPMTVDTRQLVDMLDVEDLDDIIRTGADEVPIIPAGDAGVPSPRVTGSTGRTLVEVALESIGEGSYRYGGARALRSQLNRLFGDAGEAVFRSMHSDVRGGARLRMPFARGTVDGGTTWGVPFDSKPRAAIPLHPGQTGGGQVIDSPIGKALGLQKAADSMEHLRHWVSTTEFAQKVSKLGGRHGALATSILGDIVRSGADETDSPAAFSRLVRERLALEGRERMRSLATEQYENLVRNVPKAWRESDRVQRQINHLVTHPDKAFEGDLGDVDPQVRKFAVALRSFYDRWGKELETLGLIPPGRATEGNYVPHMVTDEYLDLVRQVRIDRGMSTSSATTSAGWGNVKKRKMTEWWTTGDRAAFLASHGIDMFELEDPAVFNAMVAAFTQGRVSNVFIEDPFEVLIEYQRRMLTFAGDQQYKGLLNALGITLPDDAFNRILQRTGGEDIPFAGPFRDEPGAERIYTAEADRPVGPRDGEGTGPTRDTVVPGSDLTPDPNAPAQLDHGRLYPPGGTNPPSWTGPSGPPIPGSPPWARPSKALGPPTTAGVPDGATVDVSRVLGPDMEPNPTLGVLASPDMVRREQMAGMPRGVQATRGLKERLAAMKQRVVQLELPLDDPAVVALREAEEIAAAVTETRRGIEEVAGLKGGVSLEDAQRAVDQALAALAKADPEAGKLGPRHPYVPPPPVPDVDAATKAALEARFPGWTVHKAPGSGRDPSTRYELRNHPSFSRFGDAEELLRVAQAHPELDKPRDVMDIVREAARKAQPKTKKPTAPAGKAPEGATPLEKIAHGDGVDANNVGVGKAQLETPAGRLVQEAFEDGRVADVRQTKGGMVEADLPDGRRIVFGSGDDGVYIYDGGTIVGRGFEDVQEAIGVPELDIANYDLPPETFGEVSLRVAQDLQNGELGAFATRRDLAALFRAGRPPEAQPGHAKRVSELWLHDMVDKLGVEVRDYHDDAAIDALVEAANLHRRDTGHGTVYLSTKPNKPKGSAHYPDGTVSFYFPEDPVARGVVAHVTGSIKGIDSNVHVGITSYDEFDRFIAWLADGPTVTDGQAFRGRPWLEVDPVGAAEPLHPKARPVSTEWLAQFREFDRTPGAGTTAGDAGQDLIDDIAERGIVEELILEVDRDGRAALVEGNNRLAVAELLGIDEVPVRVVVKQKKGSAAGSGKGAAGPHDAPGINRDFLAGNDDGYVPADADPYTVFPELDPDAVPTPTRGELPPPEELQQWLATARENVEERLLPRDAPASAELEAQIEAEVEAEFRNRLMEAGVRADVKLDNSLRPVDGTTQKAIRWKKSPKGRSYDPATRLVVAKHGNQYGVFDMGDDWTGTFDDAEWDFNGMESLIDEPDYPSAVASAESIAGRDDLASRYPDAPTSGLAAVPSSPLVDPSTGFLNRDMLHNLGWADTKKASPGVESSQQARYVHPEHSQVTIVEGIGHTFAVRTGDGRSLPATIEQVEDIIRRQPDPDGIRALLGAETAPPAKVAAIAEGTAYDIDVLDTFGHLPGPAQRAAQDLKDALHDGNPEAIVRAERDLAAWTGGMSSKVAHWRSMAEQQAGSATGDLVDEVKAGIKRVLPEAGFNDAWREQTFRIQQGEVVLSLRRDQPDRMLSVYISTTTGRATADLKAEEALELLDFLAEPGNTLTPSGLEKRTWLAEEAASGPDIVPIARDVAAGGDISRNARIAISREASKVRLEALRVASTAQSQTLRQQDPEGFERLLDLAKVERKPLGEAVNFVNPEDRERAIRRGLESLIDDADFIRDVAQLPAPEINLTPVDGRIDATKTPLWLPDQNGRITYFKGVENGRGVVEIGRDRPVRAARWRSTRLNPKALFNNDPGRPVLSKGIPIEGHPNMPDGIWHTDAYTLWRVPDPDEAATASLRKRAEGWRKHLGEFEDVEGQSPNVGKLWPAPEDYGVEATPLGIYRVNDELHAVISPDDASHEDVIVNALNLRRIEEVAEVIVGDLDQLDHRLTFRTRDGVKPVIALLDGEELGLIMPMRVAHQTPAVDAIKDIAAGGDGGLGRPPIAGGAGPIDPEVVGRVIAQEGLSILEAAEESTAALVRDALARVGLATEPRQPRSATPPTFTGPEDKGQFLARIAAQKDPNRPTLPEPFDRTAERVPPPTVPPPPQLMRPGWDGSKHELESYQSILNAFEEVDPLDYVEAAEIPGARERLDGIVDALVLHSEEASSWQRPSMFVEEGEAVFRAGNPPGIKTHWERVTEEAGLHRQNALVGSGRDARPAASLRDSRIWHGVLMDDFTRDALKRFGHEGRWESFMSSVFEPYMRWFRTQATVGRGPGFLVRNLIGGLSNARLVGATARDMVDGMRVAQMWRRANTEVSKGATTAEFGEALSRARLRAFEKMVREAYSEDTAQAIMDAHELFIAHGLGDLRQMSLAELADFTGRSRLFDRKRASDLNPLEQVLEKTALGIRPVTVWTSDRTKDVEHALRFGSFMAGVRRYGMEDGGYAASMLTKASQFDYGDLSQFERDVMRQIIPFYTFTRKNLPLQVRGLLRDPAKFAHLQRLMQELEAAEGAEEDTVAGEMGKVLPDWLEEDLGFLTRNTLGGGFAAIRAESPKQALEEWLPGDVSSLKGSVSRVRDTVMSQSNPLLEAGMGLASGRDPYTGAEIGTADSAGNYPDWALRTLSPLYSNIGRLAPALPGPSVPWSTEADESRSKGAWLSTVLGAPITVIDEKAATGALRARAAELIGPINERMEGLADELGVDEQDLRTLIRTYGADGAEQVLGVPSGTLTSLGR